MSIQLWRRLGAVIAKGFPWNFDGLDLKGAQFTQDNLQDIIFRTHGSYATFVHLGRCTFRKANLDNASFHDLDIPDANFRLASMKQCEFFNCSLTRVNMRNVVGLRMTIYHGACNGLDLSDSFLHNAIIQTSAVSNPLKARRIWAEASNWENAYIPGADFTEAQLQHANFDGAMLSRVKFTRANLDGAHWWDSHGRIADITGATGVWSGNQ